MEGGTRPNTSGVTTPDPFDLNLEFDDASNGLSEYSSCEESEFERYCSANSVMGSTSFCSSVGTCNDFFDSDFGSSRSLGGVEDGRAAWRIKNWTKSIPSSQVGLIGGGVLERQSSNVGAAYQLGGCSDTNGEGSVLLRDQRRRDVWLNEKHEFGSVVGENSDECLTRRSEFNSLLCKGVRVESVNEKGTGDSGCFDRFNGVVEEEETSVRGEYSDDDDDGDGSILSYDTDDDRRRSLHYCQEVKRQNENPLLINSSVAFGSDDWDEFIQESERTSLAFDRLQDERQRHLETEAIGVSSAYVAPSDVPNLFRPGKEQTVRGVSVTTSGVNHTEDFKMDMGSGLVSDSLVQEDLLAQETSLNIGSNIIDGSLERELKFVSNEEVIGRDESDVLESVLLGKSQLQVDPLSNVTDSHLSYSTSEEPVGKKPLLSEGLESNVLSSTVEDNFDVHSKTISGYSPALLDQIEDQFSSIKVENLDSVESYDEVVLEMEEILLDSTESHGARFPQGNRASLTQLPQPFRDGSSTASTSGMGDPYPLSQHSLKVDWVEVIGAKQKKGDVSLGERIVGVKEYTVYVLRVRSGQDQWEVGRRYRDFVTLYRQLKTLFADHGWTLPSPWSLVEQESRKIFGNASPNVVSQRSTLIQECLVSILRSGCPNGTQSILLWFLSPQKVGTSPSILNSLFPQSVPVFTGDVSTLGKTIAFLVETQPRKSVKQLLEAQHNSCAGCHKRLDAEKTLMRELVQTLGWGKPRLCEYTGQLFCASCHTNDTAVLPARVLHFWDFTEYPVSQLAKSYLDSIYDQPMLCVSAVNPFLFSKVPPLLHVMGIRKKIGSMMLYVRCPFRRSIQRGVGSRRYLLESNEFFALRDLVDLSKGAFSALPVMVETVFKKILEHITQQCLVCCDVGIPCGARHACEDPSSLIFPFQEDEIRRCSSCQLVFHEPCFRDISHCGCGANFKTRNSAETSNQVKGLSSNEYNVALQASVEKPASRSSVGFISNLFSRAKQETIKRPKKSNPVILMGSLPSTFSDPLS